MKLSAGISNPLLMIPGPVELSPAVQNAQTHTISSHVSPAFTESFGQVLENLRTVFLAEKSSQAFVIGGSGTIAMEMAALNVCQPNDRAIVMNSGFFGDRMERMLRRRSVHVVSIKAKKIGGHPSLAELEETLLSGDFKAVFGTHVDTSTGVLLDVKSVAKLAKQNNTLSVFDGVCASAGEEFRMEEWGVDIYFTASQKAIGLPPGLAILVASERAMKARKTLSFEPPLSIDWLEWLPIMKSYELRKPSYFSTPPVSLIHALDISLQEILAVGMEKIFSLHQQGAKAIRSFFRDHGFTFVPESEHQANTLSAIYYGEHPKIVELMKEKGVIFAGGLHPEIKKKYFRIGHMGYSVRNPEHLDFVLKKLAEIL